MINDKQKQFNNYKTEVTSYLRRVRSIPLISLISLTPFTHITSTTHLDILTSTNLYKNYGIFKKIHFIF